MARRWFERTALGVVACVGLALAPTVGLAQEKGAIDPRDAQIIEDLRKATTVFSEDDAAIVRAFAAELDRDISAAFDAQPETRDEFFKALTAIAALKDTEEKLRAAERFTARYRDAYLSVLESGGVDLKAHAERLQKAFIETGRTDLIVRLREDLAFAIEHAPTNTDDPWNGVRFPIDGDAEPPPPPAPPPPMTRALGASDYVDAQTAGCIIAASGSTTIDAANIRSGSTVALGGECRLTGSKLARIARTVRPPAVSTSGQAQVSAFAIGIGGFSICTTRADVMIFNADRSSGGSRSIFRSAMAPLFWVAFERGATTLSGGSSGSTVTVFYTTSTFAAGGPAVAILTATGADCRASITGITTTVTQ